MINSNMLPEGITREMIIDSVRLALDELEASKDLFTSKYAMKTVMIHVEELQDFLTLEIYEFSNKLRR